MRRLCVLLLLLAFPLPAVAADRSSRNGGDLYLLGIAIDQYPDKENKETFDSYDWCVEEMAKVFQESARPLFRQVHTRLILGKQVTHGRAMAGLAWLENNATPHDLVIVSVDAHGFTDPKQGWGIDTADNGTLWGREIKTALGRLPCQAIAVVETCTSGGFARSHSQDVPLPPNVTAICACRAGQSTDNNLDIAVSEALWGKADFNGDGVVTLDELLRYVRVRHKELVPDQGLGKDHELPLLVKARTAPAGLPLTRVSPGLVAVAFKGEWHEALLEGQEGTTYHVHLLGWDSKPGPYFLTDTVDRKHICLPGDPPPVVVSADGKSRLARLVSSGGGECVVRYIGGKKDVVSRGQVKAPFAGELDQAK
jgi:hypothetical protein